MKKKFILSGISLLLFFGLIYAIKNIDVNVIGPENTAIGLSELNEFGHNLFGYKPLLYKISDYLGYLCIAAGTAVGIMGIVQLFKRKSFFKVDEEIYAFAVLLVVILTLYVMFEIVIINYRPVILEGDLHVEASFPSSHTVLSLCVALGVASLLNKYVESIRLRLTLKIVLYGLAILTTLLRLISGVHWISDILGGSLISTCILLFFSGIIDYYNE